MTTQNVAGLKELNKALEQLPGKLQDKAIKNAMAAGARVIRKEARRLVPVETGTLQESIVVSRTVQQKGRRRTIKGGVVVGIKDEARAYSHLVEFGTSRASAHPFLRPALDNQQRAAINKIGPKIGSEVEKQARKLGEKSNAAQRKAFSR